MLTLRHVCIRSSVEVVEARDALRHPLVVRKVVVAVVSTGLVNLGVEWYTLRRVGSIAMWSTSEPPGAHTSVACQTFITAAIVGFLCSLNAATQARRCSRCGAVPRVRFRMLEPEYRGRLYLVLWPLRRFTRPLELASAMSLVAAALWSLPLLAFAGVFLCNGSIKVGCTVGLWPYVSVCGGLASRCVMIIKTDHLGCVCAIQVCGDKVSPCLHRGRGAVSAVLASLVEDDG